MNTTDKIEFPNQISNFLLQSPRNKLVVVSSSDTDIPFVNLNKLLAKRLKPIINKSSFSLRAKDLITQTLNEHIESNNQIGNYLAIAHLGILFEKELFFDFISFLDSFSKTNTLIIKWDGELLNSVLFFRTIEKGIQFNIAHLNHITL